LITKVSARLEEREMTSLVRSIGLAVGILVVAGVQNASAQIIYPVEFTTSFAFTVGNATVPAGRYTIRPDDDNPAILELTGAHAGVLFQTQDTEARQTPAKTEVVFKRYGTGYVLKDIFLEGSDTGAESISVEGEKHAAKQRGQEAEEHIAATKVDTSKNR
jgi:hypothetical protein